MNRAYIVFWFVFDAALTATGDYFLKKWSLDRRLASALWAYGSYMLMLFSGFFLMGRESALAKMSAILLVGSVIIATIIGVGLFGEPLAWTTKVGLGLGVASLIFLMV